MNLSRYFTLAEMSHSNTAVVERIPNLPGDAERAQLAALCTQVLDPLREAVGASIRVNSGYRGPALNARLRGSTTSQHLKGQAADIQTAAVSVLDLFKMVIRLGLPFDQLIFEAKNATSKWVHVSHNPGGNRGEIRVAEFDASGKPVRYPQISAEQALALVDRVTRSSRPGQWPDYFETSDEPEHGPGHETVQSPPPAVSVASARPAPPEKAAAKPTSTQPTPIKPPPSKKVPGKKAPSKKAPSKEVSAKKAPVKKAPVKKAPAKTATPAQPPAAAPAPARKAPARKRPAQTVAPKKTAAPKQAARKAATSRSR